MSITKLEIPNFAGLPDLCAAILATTAQLRDVEEPGRGPEGSGADDPERRCENFRQRIKQMVEEMEARARQAAVPQEHIHLCKYALVALLDEVVLQSGWSFRDRWMGKPLQLEYFNDFNAGDEFFRKLNSLRGDRDAEKLEVLEVYYHCLALGFRGKYIDLEGMEQRKLLIDSVGREIVDARKYKPASLSEHWQRTENLQDRVRNSPPWLIPLGGAAILLLVYIVYYTVLRAYVHGVPLAS